MKSLRVTAQAGEALDELVFRAVGVTAGAVEATLEANRGLAELGPTLPEGTAVDVPVPDTPAPAVDPVQLWS